MYVSFKNIILDYLIIRNTQYLQWCERNTAAVQHRKIEAMKTNSILCFS